MKNVQDMSLEQKLMELQQCVSKAKVGAENPGSVEYEFLLNAKLGDGRDEKVAYYANLVANTKTLMSRLSQLDYDVREQAVRDINAKLDDALLVFPGYEKAVQQNLGR